MFSANENILLRQHKRRIVEKVESCIPVEVLDLGVNVMVMQVSCKAPGCVPLETAMIIVFPTTANSKELLPGLPESAGGSFKTKILKPMAEVTDQDVLEALPPQFAGGLRTLERVALTARDFMLAQVEQIFDSTNDKRALAQYLQQALQDYIDQDCKAPAYGEPFPTATTTEATTSLTMESPGLESTNNAMKQESPPPQQQQPPFPSTGNIVLKRPVDDESLGGAMSSSSKNSILQRPATTETKSTVSRNTHSPASTTTTAVIGTSRQGTAREMQLQRRTMQGISGDSGSTLRRMMEKQEHAAGIRRRGCPCCDPDNPGNVADLMLAQF